MPISICIKGLLEYLWVKNAKSGWYTKHRNLRLEKKESENWIKVRKGESSHVDNSYGMFL